MGICDATVFRPGFPQITQEGNAIRFLKYGHHWDTDDLCIYPIGTLTDPVGAFPPGEYTLTVDLLYQDFFGEPLILNIGVVPFTVSGVTPSAAPVPTSSLLGLSVLLVLTSSLAAWTLRARRRSGC